MAYLLTTPFSILECFVDISRAETALRVKFEPVKMASASRRAPQKWTAVARTSAAAAADFCDPGSSDDSTNDVDSVDLSSDEDAPVQMPQTWTGAASKGSFFTLQHICKKRRASYLTTVVLL